MLFSEVITPKAIKIYIDESKRNVNAAPYLGEALFPAVKQAELDMKFFTGEEDMPTVLKPTAYDAEVPLRDRIGVDLIQGEMPFYREGFLVKEVDRRNIQRANASGDTAMKAAVSHVYKDAGRLVDGADAAAERMRMQLLAAVDGHPKITINANGVSMVYNYDPNNKYSSNNYLALSGTSMWTAYSTADPVKDLADAKTAMANKGIIVTRAIMSAKTFSDLKKNTALWSYAIATTGLAGGALFHSDALAKQIVKENAGVDIVVYNKSFKDESGNVTGFFADNVVTLIPDGSLGETRYAPTPEEDAYSGNDKASVEVAIVGTGVCVSHKHYDVPVKEEFIAGQVCMPSYEGMYSTYTIKTYTA